MLRLFFWKDMLARKKREQDENKLESPEKSEIAKLKIVKRHTTKSDISRTTGSLSRAAKKGDHISIIRSKRSQADDQWPISYKGDLAKKSNLKSYQNIRQKTDTNLNVKYLKQSKKRHLLEKIDLSTKQRDKRLSLESIKSKVSSSEGTSFSSLFTALHSNAKIRKFAKDLPPQSQVPLLSQQHQQRSDPRNIIGTPRKNNTSKSSTVGEEVLHRTKRIGEKF